MPVCPQRSLHTHDTQPHLHSHKIKESGMKANIVITEASGSSHILVRADTPGFSTS